MQPTRVPEYSNSPTPLGYETPHNQSTQSGYRVNMAYVRNEGETPSPQPARPMPVSGYQGRQMPVSNYSQRSLAANDIPVNESSQYLPRSVGGGGGGGDSTPHNLSFQPVGDTTYMSRVDGRPAAPIAKAPGFDYINWRPYDKVFIRKRFANDFL